MADHSFPHDLEPLIGEDAEHIGEHPEPETLLAFSEGRLDPGMQEEVFVHLGLCPKCAQTILDLTSFPTIEHRDPSHPQRTEADQAASWAAIEAAWDRENEDAAGASSKIAIPDPGSIEAKVSLSRVWMQAAAVTVALVGLGILGLRFREEGSPTPRPNVHVAELLSINAVGVRSQQGNRVILPPSATALVLILVRDSADPAGPFTARLERGEGQRLWTLTGLAPSADGSFSLLLAREFLHSGRYRIELLVAGDSGRSPLGSYIFDLEIE